MAAASFPWFANPWEGVCASDAPVGVPVAVVAVPPDLPDLVDIFDDEPGNIPAFMLVDDDPLELAAALAVDELITAAQTAACIRAELAVLAAAEADDAAVALRLAAIGICGAAAISLIASSVVRSDDVADAVLGVDHTAAAAALHRVWTAANFLVAVS